MTKGLNCDKNSLKLLFRQKCTCSMSHLRHVIMLRPTCPTLHSKRGEINSSLRQDSNLLNSKQVLISELLLIMCGCSSYNGVKKLFVVPSAGGKGTQMHPLWRLVMYFCVHTCNCTSPSNDYAAEACRNNNQAQFTHVSVTY